MERKLKATGAQRRKGMWQLYFFLVPIAYRFLRSSPVAQRYDHQKFQGTLGWITSAWRIPELLRWIELYLFLYWSSWAVHSYKVYKEKTFWSYHLWTNHFILHFILHFISHYAAPGPPEKLTCKITDNYNVHVKWDPPEDNLFLYPVLCYILQSSSGKTEGGKICYLSSLWEWVLVEKETFWALVLC